MTIAYVYKWTHIPSGKWYIGVRTKSGCHPDDGYLCSSRIVKPMILSNREDWKREIIATGTPDDMMKLEVSLLTEVDAKNNPDSFNLQNGDGNWTTTGLKMPDEWRKKISKGNTGKKRTNDSIENYKKASRKKAQDPVFIKNLSDSLKGKPKSEEHKKKLSGEKSEQHKKNLSISLSITSKKLRSGKTYEEIFGEEAAAIIKNKSSQTQKGRPCNNRIVTCPHCFKEGYAGAMKLWHFEKCRKNV